MIVDALKWIAGKVLRLVPESILGRFLPPAFRFDSSSLPPLPPLPQAGTRLIVAPVNYAGQGYEWARAAARHRADTAAMNLMVVSGFQHPADEVVPLGYYAASRRWQRRQAEWVATEFSHLLVEAELQPFGAVLDESTRRQVEQMLARGLKVAMVCHGSDIRLPSAHRERYPASPFRDDLAKEAVSLERTASRNRRLLDRLGLPTFVSTPDLVLDVPYAQWLPVVVDVERWSAGSRPLQRMRPIVAHAPSKGPMKGSNRIDPIMRRLDEEGLIEYRRVERIPYAQMPEVYRDADIVLDQFRLADYGVAACEAMATGRVVIAHVSDNSRRIVRETVGVDAPILEATVESLEQVVRDLVADREKGIERASAGPEFVRAAHDGTRSAGVLDSFLSS